MRVWWKPTPCSIGSILGGGWLAVSYIESILSSAEYEGGGWLIVFVLEDLG